MKLTIDEIGSDERAFLSVNSLAKRWDMSPRKLSAMRARGEGPGWTEVGGMVCYLYSDVIEYE